MDGFDISGQVVTLIAALTPVLTYTLVFFLRKGIPSIPRVALPLVASAGGIGLGYLTGYIEAGTWSVIEAAAWGAIATVGREIVTTLQEHGLGGSE